MKTTIVILLSMICFSLPAEARIPKPVWETTIKILTGTGAVFSAAQGAEAQDIYSKNDQILNDLKSRGIDPTDGAIFQLYFQIDPASAKRWFLKPNVYALVQMEGQGNFVPAAIAKGYKGQPYTVTIYGKQIRPDGRVLVHLLDDKQFWNTAWNSLLQTEVPVSIGGQFITPLVKAKIQADTTIKILNKNITFQPPGYMATAEIRVPKSEDGIWLADGTLIAGNKWKVGVIQFGQIWTPNPKIAEAKQSSKWSMIFWGGLAIVLGIVFVGYFIPKSSTSQ